MNSVEKPCYNEKEYPEIHPRRKESLIKRVCLTLEYSDPGRLLSLLRSLFENSSGVLQMKINKYIAEVTSSDLAFIVMTFLKPNEYKITVIGEEYLPLDSFIDPNSEFIQLLSEDTTVIEVPPTILSSDVKAMLESYISNMPKYQDIISSINNLLSVQIRHPVTEKILMYVVLVNTNKTVDYKRINAKLVTECMRYCSGIIVNSECFKVEKNDHNRARNFIELMREILMNIDDANDMIDKIELGICDVLNAERCTMLLRNECGDFVSKIVNYGARMDIAKDPLKNIIIPSDYGLAGIAVETGKVVNCTDAQTDPRYCTDLDNKISSPVKTVLCIPLKSGDEVIGVVEVYNKSDTTFNYQDEEIGETLGVLLPPLINHCLNDKRLRENLERRHFVDRLYLTKDEPNQELIEETLHCEVLHDYTEILSLNYSQYKQSQSHLYCLLYQFFQKLNIIKRFDIKPATLVRFFVSIFQNHCDFPFHNWRRSFGTFHFMTVLINELNLVRDGYCTLIEILALLLASLSHCADYPGAIHKFEYTCGTTLAALYSSPGHVNKVQQSSLIFRLFNSPETNILENIPNDQFETFSHIYKKLINITDLGYYLDKADVIETVLLQGFQKEAKYQRVHLLQLLMLVCSLSDYAKDFMHCRKTAELTFAELLPEVDMTQAEGIFNMKQFTDRNIELVPYLQIQFIKTFCVPVFSLFSQIFPVTYDCLERCKENLSKWETYKDKFEEILTLEKLEKENEMKRLQEEAGKTPSFSKIIDVDKESVKEDEIYD